MVISSTRRRSSRLSKSDELGVEEEETNEGVIELDSSDDETSQRKVKSQRKNSFESDDDVSPKKIRAEENALRKSSRSSRFKRSMKEPSGVSIADLFRDQSEKKSVKKRPSQEGTEKSVFVPNKKTKKNTDTKSQSAESSNQVKAPVTRLKSRRLDARIVASDEDSQSFDDDEDSEDEEELKIQKVIACSSRTLNEWKKICKNINTTEIEQGSRWFQTDKPEPDDGDIKFEERFLIKWADLSFLHCSWETEDDLLDQVEGAKGVLNIFFRKNINGLVFDADERADGEYFDPSFTQIERILDITEPESDADVTPQSKSKRESLSNVDRWGIILDKTHPDYEGGTGRQFLVKWANMGYSESTYEFERDLIVNSIEYDEFVISFQKRSKKPSKAEMKKLFTTLDDQKRRLYKVFGDNIKDDENKHKKIEEYKKRLETNVFKNGGQLRDYQCEGVAWMLSNYINQRSSILADEMGLGKTCQTAIFVNMLATTLSARGPYLVVAPLSTIPHWQREFSSWTSLNTIAYHGSALDREYIREFEFAFESDRPPNLAFNQKFLKKCHNKNAPKWQRTWMVTVVITTPEMLVTDDFSELTSVEWELVVVDEAHRLKNHSSKLAVNLRDKEFNFKNSLLLTGTPIQNNMQELWTLLNVVDPVHFASSTKFLEKYGDVKSKELIDELHENIRPYILRRLKEDVEKSVPPKEETLIEVELTVLQKQYYRALYEKNVQFLHRNHKKALDGPSISNLAMQLRKCCNHPFLLRGVENEIKSKRDHFSSHDDEADFLVKASGKFVLLDKLLPKLKEGGHRVLIFSQFKIMLDILEDYLRLRRLKVERIDGSITGKKRQMAIDRFQADGDTDSSFVMLLSTRAGGVGINLTAADTCIIFDSDWNPQNDLQAQARCHRIGQTKSVKVYRLLSRKTYEMQMFHMSSLKMGLDQAVLQGFENGPSKSDGAMTKAEIEKLLRHGAYDIFNEEKAGTSEKESNDFIDQDIDSILERRAKTIIHDNTGSKSNVAGGTFSKASFKASNAASGGTDEVDVDDPDFWKKMVGEAKAEKHNDLTGKKRKRFQKSYSEREYERKMEAQLQDGVQLLSDDDAESDYGSSSSDSESSELLDKTEFDFSSNTVLFDETLKELMERKKKTLTKKERSRWGGKSSTEWSKSDVNIILKFIHRYGYGNKSWNVLNMEMTAELSKKYDDAEVKRMYWSLVLFAFKEAVEDDARDAGRLRSTENGTSQKIRTDGGSLGSIEKLDSIEKHRDLIISSFKKLLESSSCVEKALNDAIEFAKTSKPRKNLLTGNSAQDDQSPLVVAFNESVWPALRSRGWKEESFPNDSKNFPNGSFVKKYSMGVRSFYSVASVLDTAILIHPELKNMIKTIISAAAAKTDNKSLNGNETQTNKPSINIKKINAEDLSDFLYKYAPLQLVTEDHKKGKHKAFYSPKMLSVLEYLNTAYTLIGLVEGKRITSHETSSVSDQRLKLLLSVHGKAILPHPLWSSSHDVTLIRSIVKHGWIGLEDNFKAINEDKSIRWGSPFEQDGSKDISLSSKSKGAKIEANERVLQKIMKSVASRVVTFLNHNQSLIRDIKSLDIDLIAKCYGLVKNDINGDTTAVSNAWIVDDSRLLRHIKNSRSDGEIVEQLPTRKTLLKRSKMLLSRAKSHLSSAGSGSESENFYQLIDKFSILDQNNQCNIFLAEIIRSVMKIDAKGRKHSRNLIEIAIKEAELRKADEVSNNSSSGGKSNMIYDLERICEYLRQVSRNLGQLRQSRNVLRVILGLFPVFSKNEFDSHVFPVEKMKPSKLTDLSSKTISSGEVGKLKSAAGDIAINKGITVMRLRKNTTHQNDKNNKVFLKLTSIETLLLSVVCSQGLPVFNGNWECLIFEGQSNALGTFPGEEFVINWYLMGDVIEAAAREWLNLSTKKLHQLEESSDDKCSIGDQHKRTKDDVEIKKRTLREAEILRRSPRRLAQKIIMVMEALRVKMGVLNLPNEHPGKKFKSISELEYGLGPHVLQWLSNHLTKWADVLSISKNGRPFATTESDFMGDHPEVKPTAVLDEKSCRTIFIQVAQQTRLRSLFIRNGMSTMCKQISNAVKISQDSGDVWKARPSWWRTEEPVGERLPNQDDIDLLVGLLVYGYSGFDEFVRSSESFYPRLKEERANKTAPINITQLAKSVFTRASVQQRVNQLTRELDVSADSDRLVFEKEKVTGGTSITQELHKGIESFLKSTSNANN